ncbi:LysR family transcriptional regulator [Consotaella salsifontis]|uniref:Transcriptional regulator, LysR family n=1 Tax=Consotaella salsifontis TaxID=1365950 RepID=A0A1T4SCA5_9HYPH|nr:LysR family transcriptional regulator [Consotaella salsifontis]SKA25940.1 transcriptional regulator, LysR family [Consotaella salsifontis]
MVDWDKLRIFHAAARAGSITRAADTLFMSQSAVSRQVSALEEELGAPLFHRHARGLILTEEGETLFQAAEEMNLKLEDAQSKLSDIKEKPAGPLRITTTVGIGSTWLTERLNEFIDLYPDVHLELILDDSELDLRTRQADVGIRLRTPTQPELVQRKLFTMHFRIYGAPSYLERFGTPTSQDQLDSHRIVTFGDNAPAYLREMNWLEQAGRDFGHARLPALKVNSLVAIRYALERGLGIGLLPDYMVEEDSDLVPLIPDLELLTYDVYFVYPDELRNSARLKVFRDFLVEKARRWEY